MDVQKLGIKFFLHDDASVEGAELIPIFHRWIQTRAVDGLLIDVVDYSHVAHGPGILLVAHEGTYGMDAGGDHMGMTYCSRGHDQAPSPQRLVEVCKRALLACQRLESEPLLGDRVRFRGDGFSVFANDRLRAANTEPNAQALVSLAGGLAERVFTDAEWTATPERVNHDRLAVSVATSRPESLPTLISRLP